MAAHYEDIPTGGTEIDVLPTNAAAYRVRLVVLQERGESGQAPQGEPDLGQDLQEEPDLGQAPQGEPDLGQDLHTPFR